MKALFPFSNRYNGIAILLVACVAAEQKREAEPSYRHGVGFPLPYGAVGGHHYGVGYGHAAIAHHPYGGHSYVQSYSHNLHKQEADPGYTHPAYGYGYGRGIGYGIGHSYGYGPAVAHHPYGGVSFSRSYNHVLHKRDADPSYGLSHGHRGSVYGYTSSVSHPGYGYSYQYNHGVVSPLHYDY
ncbi:prisilkin-39-like [Penaeus japonicus]|uniref:prisilkin-39-like n=1 Tax=Penaeus japonicus TaxID=27405 RepID=UPI001C713852|nr:prisilkin-39-like [Penaeus japonicus]